MDKLKQKSRKAESKYQEAEATNKRGIVLGSIVATLIACTPFMFNIYESVPDVRVWDTFLFTYDAKYYESVYVTAWTLTTKLVPLTLFFLWFLTCKHWWYHTILVPIALYIYQIITIVNDDLKFIDNNQILYLLPVMAIIIPSIYLMRARMFNRIIETTKSMEELEEEFMMKPKNFWGKVKQYF
jgi:hypothetical protein